MTVAPTTSTPPTSSNSSTANDLVSGQSSLNSTYSSFLTLLTAQLQNQDPLSPMDTSTFTQQLVSMNGVQQQLLSNNLLQQLVSQSIGAGSVSGAVSMIGENATSTSSVAALQNGFANWNYSLPSTAASATMEVLDSSGNIMWTGNAPNLTSGSHPVAWNGTTTSGSTAPDGNYTLAITATDASGAAITPTISISGTVTGVSSSNGVTQVDIGSVPVNFSTVTSIQKPS